MKIEDLGIGPSYQNINNNSQFTSMKRSRTNLFNFLLISQLESQKLRFITFISIIYILLQTCFISFWPHIDLVRKELVDEYDFIRTVPSYEGNLTAAFFFYSTISQYRAQYIISFVILAISLILFILSVLAFCLYYFKRIVNNQLLLCYSFFVQILCPLLLIPLGFQIGWVITKIIELKHMKQLGTNISGYGSISTFTAIVVLNCILYFISIILTIANNIFNSNSILITKSFLVTFDGIFESFIMIIPSLLILFSTILPVYYQYLRFIIVAIHMAFCACCVVWCFWLPFGIFKADCIVGSASISMLISDFLCFTKLSSYWYRYMIFIGCFILFFFVMNFLLKFRIKSILKSSMKKEKEKLKDREREKEEKLKLEEREDAKKSTSLHSQLFGDPVPAPTGFEDLPVSKCLFALRIAIMMKSHVFLEGRLLDLILTKVETDLDKIEFAFMICYFPDCQSIFFSILTGLKRVNFLPLLKEYQLYQLRCFDNSCRNDSKIEEVDDLIKKSSALEIHIRSNWQTIDSECRTFNQLLEANKEENLPKNFKIKANIFSEFDRLSISISNCHASWKTLISFYPNNVQIAKEYSKFLIKCCGDFIGASEWSTLSKLIHEGKTFKFTPCHVSFLRAFPQYAKEIFDKNSNFVNLDDIEIHNKIENVGALIDMPETRFEYQRATSVSYPISIIVFILLSIISFLYIIIYWTDSLVSFDHFDTMEQSLYYIVNVGVLSEQISKSIIHFIMGYGALPSVGYFPSADTIYCTIYENGWSDRINSIYDSSVIDFYQDHKTQIAYEIEQGLLNVDFLHLAALDQVEKGNPFNQFFNIFFNNTHESVFYLSKEQTAKAVTNLQSTLISFFAFYYTISYSDDYSFVNDADFYSATISADQVLDVLENVSYSVLQNNAEVMKKVDYANSTEIYIASLIYVIFSCVSILVAFYFIRKSFKSIINSLSFYSKTIKKKASLPLISIINNNRGSTSNNNDTRDDDDDDDDNVDGSYLYKVQSKVKNFALIALVVSIVIHIILGVIIFSFHFIYMKYNKQFVAITELIHYHTFETAQLIELFYSVMAANSFGRILPNVDKKYKEKLLEKRTKFLATHENRWSYSIDGDCGVKDFYLTTINDLKNKAKCPDWPNKTVHEIIACLSEEAGLNAFIDLTDTMINSIYDPNLFHTESFIQYMYFTLTNIYYDVNSFSFYLMLAAVEKDSEFVNIHQIFGSISLIIALLLFILNILIYLKFKGIFRLLFAFISRISPSDLITNSHLLSALFKIKNMNKQEIENSETSYLVQESTLPIIFIDRATLIEFVNIAFTRKFNYEANFIVGQPISTLIDDESTLFYIDKMKFFGTKESVKKSIQISKDSKVMLFDITIIPIHDSTSSKTKNNQNEYLSQDIENEGETNKETFVNRIAIVFEDKNTEKILENKCIYSQQITNKIENIIYPPVFSLFIEGYLKMCAICLIKLPNIISKDTKAKNVMTQYTNIYKRISQKLSFYPLLFPLDPKNETFAVIGFKKNDPTELAIECLNFAFNIIDEFACSSTVIPSSLIYSSKISGQLFAVVETGGELVVGWLGDDIKKVVISGELMDRAVKVLDNASRSGVICVSRKTYECLIQHDYTFYEKEIPEEICGCNIIYSIEKNSLTVSNKSEYDPNYY